MSNNKKVKHTPALKHNISLSLKLTLSIVLVSAILITFLTYVNIADRDIFLDETYGKTTMGIAQIINASLKSFDELESQEKLQEYVQKISVENPEIISISINSPDDFGELQIFVSSDNASIGTLADPYIIEGISYTYLCYEEGNDYYILQHTDESHSVVVLTPFYLSGEIAGTYEIILSMDDAYAELDARERALILFSIILLFAVIFSFLYLLRRVIVNPITTFRDAAKVIGEGNLDKKIDIKSKDELGELASSFNQMTKDLKTSRSKIERYNKTLEKLLNQKDEFIGQLGHDLKNPLTPLVGLLPMIVQQEKDPKLKQHLSMILRNVEYMQDLIFKTLQLAKLRSSNVKFDFEDLNLYDVVESVFDTQQLILKDNKITVEDKIDEKIFVWADKLRLAEVFNNLISNSIKYTPDTGGVITVGAEKDKESVTVYIKDSGIGMTKEQLDLIFDEFYKADKFSSETISSGLGLSIVKRIVEKHGGKIWVESEGVGKGSTFFFTLKLGKGKK